MTASPGRAQGETHGTEQEPTTAGDQDPAKRDPRPDGPMNQPVDEPRANEAISDGPGHAPSRRVLQAANFRGRNV